MVIFPGESWAWCQNYWYKSVKNAGEWWQAYKLFHRFTILLCVCYFVRANVKGHQTISLFWLKSRWPVINVSDKTQTCRSTSTFGIPIWCRYNSSVKDFQPLDKHHACGTTTTNKMAWMRHVKKNIASMFQATVLTNYMHNWLFRNFHSTTNIPNSQVSNLF